MNLRLPLPLLVLVAACALLALGRAPASAQKAAPQQAPAGARYFGPWEYEVVGLTEIYGSTLDYLKGALGSGEEEDDDEGGAGGVRGRIGGMLGFGKKVDDQLVAKTRDLLNVYGADGWELAEYRENVFVFKRPVQDGK